MSVTITYLGHSGFLVQGSTHAVAIDPFLSGNPLAKQKHTEIRCQAVAVTHGHADHLGDAVAIAKANRAALYAAWEICEYCGEQGVGKCEPMNPGGRVETDFGFVALTQAFHSSSFEGRYMGNPCGVILGIDDLTIYHCGDTALFGDMKLIGEIYRPEVAMIPIGDRFTMGPALAARAAEMIGAKIAIPIHYNTWPLIAQDPANFRPRGVEVRALAPGESFSPAEAAAAR